ncbi:MAG: SpoIID/LytB domain-containing protein [bacterium]|nr:SpoIID/LytB domain-containing protein [bacterium]
MQNSKVKIQKYLSTLSSRPKGKSKFKIFNLFIIAFVLLSMFFVLDKAKALSEKCSSSKPPSGVALSTWVDNCVTEIENEVGQLKPAHERNQQELADLKKQLTTLQSQINNLNRQIVALGQDINAREEDVALQEILLEERVRSFYIKSRRFSPFLVFLSSSNATELTRTIALQGQEATEDKRIIEDLSAQIKQLKSDRESLTKNKEGLARVQVEVDKKAEFLKGEVAKVETYISTLTSYQSQLLAQKAGGFQTSIGDTPPSLEPCTGAPGASNYCNPGFTGFAAFSFGAPHRAGMSQYGAYGRSKQGQSAETILSAYYQGAELKKDYASPQDIGVNGIGRVSLEDNYLLGIYEMPESWGDKGGFEALKAQAVAARSYALAVTNNGSGSICPTEHCQVYKSQLKSGKWAEAVRATRGWVMIKNGTPANTTYSSTTGGFTINLYGWSGIKDTLGAWPDTAYEKVSESPWFYKAWYKTRSGATCGKSHPWLTQEEMADILNAWQVYFKGGGDASRISPEETGCWPGNPYSKSELVAIGGYTSASSVSVVYGDNGTTLEVTLGTNKGSISIPGEEFKKAFNLRAPGYIGIKSSLFNIVKTN